MAKSKRDLSYRLSGFIDVNNKTITELDKEGEVVSENNFGQIIQQFDGKEVTFSIKESSDLV